MGRGLGFSPVRARLYEQGCWVLSGGSSHLFISPIVKSVIREVEDSSLRAGCSAGGNALTLAFLCCFPAACREIRNSSRRKEKVQEEEDREGPVQVALGGGQDAVPH